MIKSSSEAVDVTFVGGDSNRLPILQGGSVSLENEPLRLRNLPKLAQEGRCSHHTFVMAVFCCDLFACAVSLEEEAAL